MTDLNDKLEQLIQTIKTERDELKLQLHLLKAEGKEEWEEVEQKWQHLEGRLKKVREGAAEAGEDVGAAAAQLGEEIGHAYQRIKKAMK